MCSMTILSAIENAEKIANWKIALFVQMRIVKIEIFHTKSLNLYVLQMFQFGTNDRFHNF